MKTPKSHRAARAVVLALGLTANAAAAELGRVNPHPADRELVILQLPSRPGLPGPSVWEKGPVQSLADGSRLVLVPRIPAGAPFALQPGGRGPHFAYTPPRFRRDRDALGLLQLFTGQPG